MLFQLSRIVGGFVGGFPDLGGIPPLAERLPLQGTYCRKRRAVRDVPACALSTACKLQYEDILNY